MKKIWVYFLLIIFISACANSKPMVNTETVKKLEIDKFLGQWYEIARYPHSFEKDLVGVTATYSMREDGKIKVLNQGYKNTLNGELKTAEGKAKIPDKNDPSKLKVSFFWFFYADYLVMELDSENYQWAVIGSSSPNYLWILSRTPQMEKDLYMDLLQKIEKRGYDTSKLLLVEQNQD